jgi:hypothetical protein
VRLTADGKSFTQRVMKMSVAEKIKLATLGNREARTLLLRDANKLVCMAAAMSPRISDGEILGLATSRTVNSDVLRYIYSNRDFLKTYAIKISLVKNPKVPLPTALKMMYTLQEKDIKSSPAIATPQTIQAQAKAWLMKKEQATKGQRAESTIDGMDLAETTNGEVAAPRQAPVRVGRAVWLSAATMACAFSVRARHALRDRHRREPLLRRLRVAFRILNLLRDPFAEGALVRVRARLRAGSPQLGARRGLPPRERGRCAGPARRRRPDIARCRLLGSVVAAIAPGLEERALASLLTRVMMPFLLLVSLSAVAMGMLNAQSRFTVPALAPALFNVGSIGVGAALWAAGWPPEKAVVGWAVGTMVGGFLQLAVQVPTLRALGYRLRVRLSRKDLADPGLRRIGRLMAMAVGRLSATNVNVLVNTWFASHGRRQHLAPHVVPAHAAAARRVRRGNSDGRRSGVAQAAARDMPGVKQTLGSAMRLVAFLNVPSAIGLAVLARPIVSLIYEHGRFEATDAGCDGAGARALRDRALLLLSP